MNREEQVFGEDRWDRWSVAGERGADYRSVYINTSRHYEGLIGLESWSEVEGFVAAIHAAAAWALGPREITVEFCKEGA